MMDYIPIEKAVTIVFDTVKKYEGARCYLDTGGLNGSTINQLESFSFDKRPSRANQNVKIGDIILARMKNTFKVKVIEIEDTDKLVSTGFVVLRPHKNFDKRFLFHIFKSGFFQREKDKLCTGATQQAINNNNLIKLKIPQILFEDQQRIGKLLDYADSINCKNLKILEKFDELTKSVFLEMFGDPFINPKGFKSLILGEISEIVSGVTKGRKLEGTDLLDLPYMRVANVQDGYLNIDEIKTILCSKQELENYKLMKGDILLTEGGDPDKLGRGALWNNEIQNCIHQNHIFRVRITSNTITPLFLSKLVGSKYGKMYFLKSSKQTTGIASINKTQLKNFPVLIPNMNLQLQFEKLILNIEEQQLLTQQSLVRSEELFQSLLQRAFKGEL